jgi:hypothetical protein
MGSSQSQALVQGPADPDYPGQDVVAQLVLSRYRAGLSVAGVFPPAVAPFPGSRLELPEFVVRQRFVEHLLIHTEHHGISPGIPAGRPGVD